MGSLSPAELAVEDSICAHFAALGWRVVDATHEPLGPTTELGRLTRSDAFLTRHLDAALSSLNPTAPPAARAEALALLTRDRSAMVAASANREVYELLRDGTKVTLPDAHGADATHHLRFIDWDDPSANSFLLVRQLTVAGRASVFRPDLVGFVNGVPLVLGELKAPTVDLSEALTKNLAPYRDTETGIPQLFVPNALVLLSNAQDTRVGSTTATSLEHFYRWTRLTEDSPRSTDFTVALTAVFTPKHLLDIVENFVLFEQSSQGLRKLVAQNHQVHGVNAAFARIAHYGALLDAQPPTPEAQLVEARKLGVYWHTQGSGKSYSMALLVRKVHRKLSGDWSFVVVTDREDLDKQIYANFVATGAAPPAKGKTLRAASAKDLAALLKAGERVTFTLVQKFRATEDSPPAKPTKPAATPPATATPAPETAPASTVKKSKPKTSSKPLGVISPNARMIVLADEAHRSQSEGGTFSDNMRSALPYAGFLAFTGTPLLEGDKATRERFGSYVSKYPFFRAIEDGATVPLYYEASIPDLQLTDEHLDRAIDAATKRANLTDEDEDALGRELATAYAFLTLSDRLDKVAASLFDHFMGFAPTMKAMAVSIDRPTTLRLLQRVEIERAKRLRALEDGLAELPYESYAQRAAQERAIDMVRSLEFAAVLSRSQGDLDELAPQLRYNAKGVVAEEKQRTAYEKAAAETYAKQAQTGVAEAYSGAEALGPGSDEAKKRDLAEARAWINAQLNRDPDALAKRFKNPTDPLRLVFVCSMWITGFDAPPCGIVYLDRPMANHTLMQTIARANRVHPGKDIGLVMDYVGVLKNLERAFTSYERELSGKVVDRPVADKTEVLAKLAAAIESARTHCTLAGVNLAALREGDAQQRLNAHTAAVNALTLPGVEVAKFRGAVSSVRKLFAAMGNDPRREQHRADRDTLDGLAAGLATLDDPSKLRAVLEELEKVLDEGLSADTQRPAAEVPRIAIADIDLAAIAKLANDPLGSAKAKALGESLKSTARDAAQQNPTLLGLQQHVEEALEAYAKKAKDLQGLLDELATVAKELEAQRARAAAEGLTGEELASFDVLLASLDEGARGDGAVREGLKKSLRRLTGEMREVNADWRQTDQSRKAVSVRVRDALNEGLGAALPDEARAALRERLWQRFYEG